jgi:chromosome segregation ATPase
VGVAVMSAAGQPRQRPSLKRSTSNPQSAETELIRGFATSKIELANAPENASTKLSERVKQNTRKIAPGQMPFAHRETSIALTSAKNVAEPNGGPSSLTEGRVLRDRAIRLRRTSLDSIVDKTVHLSGLLIDSGAVASDQKILELKDELGSAQEERIHWENESRSLQASLDLLMSENSRLSRCLEESATATNRRVGELEGELGAMRQRLVVREDENRSLQASLAGAEEARSQLEQKKAALIAADAELNKLAFALNDSDEKRQTEINALNARLQAESARAVVAEKRVAELDGELGAMRRRLVVREDENRSLQASLAGADEARSQLEQKKAALIAADAELNKLAIAVNDSDEKRQTEINALNSCLRAESARAVVAEKLLAEARDSWLIQIQEYSTAERRIADTTTALEAANLKVELLENSLWVKERQLQELEQSSSKLIEGTLKSFNALDMALACDQRIQFLTQRVAQLETETKNYAEAQHEPNDQARKDAINLPQIEASSTETLLASTLTF